MEAPNQSKKSTSSVIALVLAIISLLLSAIPIVNNFAFVLAIIALIFGFIAIRGTRNGRRSGRKMAVVSIVLALLAGVIVLASQNFYGNAIDSVGEEVQESLDTATGKNTDEILGKEVDVILGNFEVTPSEFSTETKLPVKVTNKNSEPKSYSIQIEAVDGSGVRIAEETVYANNLGSGQAQDFKAFEFVQSDKLEALKTAKFKVISVSQY